jgi:UPF0755 protein
MNREAARRSQGWRWLVVGLSAAVVMALGAIAAFWYWQVAPRQLASDELIVVIPRGAGVGQVADQMAKAFGDPTPFWRLLAKATNTRQVVAGYYRFRPGITPAEAWRQIVAGDVIRDRLTIIEGWTFAQMQAAIDSHPYLSHTLAGAAPQTILQAIAAKVPFAEGWFFPDTYLFDRMTPDRDLYRQAHEQMVRTVAAVWAERDPDLPLGSPEELLILASLIEKETGHPDDRAKVASVFVNRLRRGMPLQSDPTAVYGVSGRPDGPITRTDLARDHAHNTYTRSGLPPTPIALPSLASLKAAAHPERTDYLYFVATGTGGRSHFSRTLSEHNRAVKAYRAAVAANSASGSSSTAPGESSREQVGGQP